MSCCSTVKMERHDCVSNNKSQLSKLEKTDRGKYTTLIMSSIYLLLPWIRVRIPVPLVTSVPHRDVLCGKDNHYRIWPQCGLPSRIPTEHMLTHVQTCNQFTTEPEKIS